LKSFKKNSSADIKILQTKVNFLTPDTYRGLPLHSGQIVVSESGNQYSLFFSIMPEQYAPHIHAGILIFDGDKPYVYEALGSLGLFMGSEPTDNISGHIRRRPFKRFIDNENYTSIYNLPENIDKDKVIQYALEHFKNKTPFDPYTDTESHDRLYCTEFVAMALAAGSDESIALTPYRKNNSIKKIRNWLKFVSDKIILADSLVQLENHVVTLSSRLTLRELRLYVLTRYELHRRFTKNQRLGNLFKWSGVKLGLREPVEQFKESAMDLFEKDNQPPSWELAYVAVAKLADQMLGYFPKNDDALKQVKLLNYRIP
jgi:hypothetical protein